MHPEEVGEHSTGLPGPAGCRHRRRDIGPSYRADFRHPGRTCPHQHSARGKRRRGRGLRRAADRRPAGNPRVVRARPGRVRREPGGRCCGCVAGDRVGPRAAGVQARNLCAIRVRRPARRDPRLELLIVCKPVDGRGSVHIRPDAQYAFLHAADTDRGGCDVMREHIRRRCWTSS